MPDYDIVKQANGNFTIYERGIWDNGDDGGCFKIVKYFLIGLFVFVIFTRIKKIGTAPTGWQIAFWATAAVAILSLLIFAIFGIVTLCARIRRKRLLKSKTPDKTKIVSCNKIDDIANKIGFISLLTFIISAVIWVIITLIIAIWVFQ